MLPNSSRDARVSSQKQNMAADSDRRPCPGKTVHIINLVAPQQPKKASTFERCLAVLVVIIVLVSGGLVVSTVLKQKSSGDSPAAQAQHFGSSQTAGASSWHREEFDVKTDPTVNEKLFLVRLLEILYGSWPTYSGNQQEFFLAMADLRALAIRYREHVKGELREPDLETCYTEFIDNLDAYGNILATTGNVREQAINQGNMDRVDSGFQAGAAGISAYRTLSQINRGNDDNGGAVALAVVAALGTYLWDSHEKEQNRDASVQQALSQAQAAITNRIMTGLANAKAMGVKLGKTNGWQDEEVGFDSSFSEAQAIQKLIDANNYQALSLLAERMMKKRPRDIWQRLEYASYAAAANSTKPSLLLQLAKDCVAATALIPAPSMYDDYRFQCVNTAAEIANVARSSEIQAGISPLGSTPTSQYAVSCYNWLKAKAPNDASGILGECRANALLADNQVDAAYAQANEVFEQRKNSYEFCYDYACIMSRMGNADNALAFLNCALSQGYCDIQHVKKDPDLAQLRRAKPTEFARLTNVAYSWNIQYGAFKDDIWLKNDSPFILTNVLIVCELAQNAKTWTPQLKVEKMMPGETATWENVISIPGSSLTKATATIYCDQNR